MRKTAKLISKEDHGVNKFYHFKVFPPIAYKIENGVPFYTDFLDINETYFTGVSLATIALPVALDDKRNVGTTLKVNYGQDWMKMLTNLCYELDNE